MRRQKQPQRGGNGTRFLLSGVRVFLENKALAEMTIQNEYGAIYIKRTTPSRSNTYAVGFDIGNDNDYNDDTGDEDE